MSHIYTSADQLIGRTPLLELTHLEKKYGLKARILAKLEYLNPAGSVKDLTLKKGVLLAAIARENKIIIPGGLTTIQEGDHVVVVTKSQVFDDLTDILL